MAAFSEEELKALGHPSLKYHIGIPESVPKPYPRLVKLMVWVIQLAMSKRNDWLQFRQSHLQMTEKADKKCQK